MAPAPNAAQGRGARAQSRGARISAAARTPDRAISLIPIALVPQLLFSGVLFPFEGDLSTTRVLSWFTIRRMRDDERG